MRRGIYKQSDITRKVYYEEIEQMETEAFGAGLEHHHDEEQCAKWVGVRLDVVFMVRLAYKGVNSTAATCSDLCRIVSRSGVTTLRETVTIY